MASATISAAGSVPAVEVRGVTKRFPGVVANRDVDVTIGAGTVHALIGENGAGKSTLMKILYGVQKPDEGSIAVNGEQVSFSSPADALSMQLCKVPGQSVGYSQVTAAWAAGDPAECRPRESR